MNASWVLRAGLVLVTVVLAGCGGGGGEGIRTPVPPATSTPKLGAADIGAQTGSLYVRALVDVTEILKAKPEVSQVRPQIEDLKESYVRKFVEFGRLREALDASGKSTVDAAIRAKLDSISNESWYATFSELQQYYFGEDQDFQALIVSFNVIGQYANFELLRKQEPADAKRLGID